MAEMRTTTVRKAITRKINLGNYENVDITCDIQQEVQWEDGNIEELLKKAEGVTKVLMIDFKKTQEEILAEVHKQQQDASGSVSNSEYDGI